MQKNKIQERAVFKNKGQGGKPDHIGRNNHANNAFK